MIQFLLNLPWNIGIILFYGLGGVATCGAITKTGLTGEIEFAIFFDLILAAFGGFFYWFATKRTRFFTMEPRTWLIMIGGSFGAGLILNFFV